MFPNILIHELLHALGKKMIIVHSVLNYKLIHYFQYRFATIGFQHEQQSPYRDDYIRINYENIQPDGVNIHINYTSILIFDVFFTIVGSLV